MRAVWLSVSRVSIRPADRGQVDAGAVTDRQQRGQESRSAATRCAWVSASPTSRRPTAPAGRQRRVLRDRGPDPVDDELGLPGVREHLEDQRPGLRVHEDATSR